MNKTLLISAPVYSASGYGAHSRDVITALWDSKLFNIKTIANGWGGSSSVSLLSPTVKDILEYTSDINTLKKDSKFTFIHIGIPSEFKNLSTTENIGITAGLEADYIPSHWVEGCNKMNLIIVPSKFIKSVFIKSGVKTRVEVVEEGVDISIFNPNAPPLPFNIRDNRFTFLASGQWLDLEPGRDRKQLGLLLSLFLTIFKDNPDVNLVLKTHLHNYSSPDKFNVNERLTELKEELQSKANVYLIHGELSDNDMAGLYTNPGISAFISLTSGEGWGRPIAEAIACGLPVIVTGWSGHMDFVDANKSIILPYKLENVPKGLPFFEPNMKWAFVDTNAVVNVMQKIVNDSSYYKDILNNARESGKTFREIFNKQNTYKKLIDLLNTGA